MAPDPSAARRFRRVTLTFRVDEDAPLVLFQTDVMRAIAASRPDLFDRIVESECEVVGRGG